MSKEKDDLVNELVKLKPDLSIYHDDIFIAMKPLGYWQSEIIENGQEWVWQWDLYRLKKLTFQEIKFILKILKDKTDKNDKTDKK